MITDKELGLKVAENPEEAAWTKIKTNSEDTIKQFKREILIHEEVLKLSDRMISKEKGQ
jgi:hypothetical protein